MVDRRTLRASLRGSPRAPAGPGASGPVGAEAHHGHRDVSGGWLRPGVFGVMDGLVSNLALISGVAGAHVAAHTVALTGMAGLIAGAFSMGTGEYTSVRSQNEATLAEVDIERRELHRAPAAELVELAEVFTARGVEEELARRVAEQLSRDPAEALRIHTQEELGVDIDRLASPWVAALSSFLAFGIGALLPLLPYLAGARSLFASIVLAGVALFGVGAAVSRFTSRGPLYSGSRQLLLGAAAAAVTFGVGYALGTSLGAR